MKKYFMSLVMVLLLAVAAYAGVNINTAGVEELQSLPGIGQSKAEAIVKYREENGNFKTTEDLMQVKGIGAKVYEKISAQVEVGK
ncbi:MAG TPA: helix-hairpin-helix domain-containing protein [Desulfobacteraceae bacterium]|nr:helix-hairpin-helix domain-containing protein [Desulfobacteraceae bacterium]